LRILPNPARKLRIKAYALHGLSKSRVGFHSVKPAKEAQVLHAVKLVIEQRRVGHVAHLMQSFLVGGAKNLDAAFGRLIQAGDHSQQR
jgi:hypothetical protein